AVIDDAMLAVLMKVNGVAIGEADGRRVIRVRMYHGLRSIVGGLRKNAYAAAVSVRSANALAAAALATIYVLPLPACVVALIWGHGAAAPAVAALGGALYVIISLILRRMTEVVAFQPRYAFAHPLGACALMYIGALSWFDGLVRREVRWRGRVYPSLPRGVGRAAILPRIKNKAE
ncbi:MAG: hypothetical protein NTW86_21910, partial [Candidatus Sumerlaeota bacterium]|nr:hypothetical protein [Candidatus Sumerlaeota bacterium]